MSTYRKAPRVRVIGEHADDCWFRGKSPESNHFYNANDPALHRNAWGTRPGWHTWIVFRCNCTRCPDVRIMVREEAVTGLVASFLRGDRR